MINIKSVEYEWVFVVGKYQGSISLKQFSKEQQLLFIYFNAFTGIWVPEEFNSHARHIGALVRLRSKPNNARVHWEQQFVPNSQVSYRTSHKKLKTNRKKEV